MRRHILLLLMALVFIGFCPLITKGQTKVDLIFADYLKKYKEIDSLVYKKSRKGTNVEIETNLYSRSIYSSKIVSGSLTLYKFGSYTEHAKPHLLFLYEASQIESIGFDCLDIEGDLKKLFDFFKKIDSAKIQTNVKEKFIKEFVKSY